MSRLIVQNETGYPDPEVERLIRFGLADLDLPDRLPLVARVVYTRVSRRPRGEAHREPPAPDPA